MSSKCNCLHSEDFNFKTGYGYTQKYFQTEVYLRPFFVRFGLGCKDDHTVALSRVSIVTIDFKFVFSTHSNSPPSYTLHNADAVMPFDMQNTHLDSNVSNSTSGNLNYKPYQKRKSPFRTVSCSESGGGNFNHRGDQVIANGSKDGSPKSKSFLQHQHPKSTMTMHVISQSKSNRTVSADVVLQKDRSLNMLEHNINTESPPPLKWIGREANDLHRPVSKHTPDQSSMVYSSSPSQFKNMDKQQFWSPRSQISTLTSGPVTTQKPAQSMVSLQMGNNTQNFPRKHYYRTLYQPKGVSCHRTDEFKVLRAKKSNAMDLDDQRMERRLDKLLHIYSPEFSSFKLNEFSSEHSSLLLRGNQVWDMFRSRHEQRLHRLQAIRRPAEQNVVKWQEDAEQPNCCICRTPFSLAVRRHHCRLCGRLICSSPHLPNLLQPQKAEQLNLWEPCSSLMVCDASSRQFREFPVRPTMNASPDQWRAFEDDELFSIRFCKDCKTKIYRIMLRNRRKRTSTPELFYEVCNDVRINTYPQKLILLEREIHEALPDFHEMIFGLQYVTIACISGF